MRILCQLIATSTVATVLVFSTAAISAPVPTVMNYQGQVFVSGEPYTGTGQFKFALVDEGANVNTPATASGTVTGGFLTAISVTGPGSG